MNKIYLFVFVFLLITTSASAATWDNTLDYDSSNKIVSVKNSLLGIIPTSEIGTVELKTGFYNLVPIGTDIKVMEFDTISAEFYLGGLGITEAYDVRRNNQSISKQLAYKVKSYQSDTRDTYTNVCTTYANKTSNCKLEKNGTEIYQREVWTTINGNDLPKGKITIGIFTDVEAGDVIDLVPTLYGKRIGRWAVYAADPANVAYYKLDEGTGTVALNSVDSAKFKLELINTPDWTLGKIGNATTYKSASTESAQNLTFSGLGRNYSVSLWVNVTSFINDLEGVIVWTTGADNGGFALEKKSGSNSLSLYTGNGATYLETTSPVITTNVWYHYVIVSNSTHVSIFLNGSLVGFTAVVANPINPNQLFLGRGAAADANRRFDGAIDEVYIINRTLSQTEINQLYNADRGLQWPFSVITEVNLTNPTNNSKFISVSGRTFNATAIVIPAGSAVNSTLYVYTSAGALIGTNFTTVSATTNKSNFTIPDLGDGTFFWNINFCPGDGSDCVFGTSNYTYSVDSTNPVVKFPLPVNNSYIYSTNSSYATFNLNVSGTDGVAIDKVWYNSTYNSTITFVTNNAITQVNLTNVFGKHTIYAFANDTAGNLAMNQSTIWIHRNYLITTAYETEDAVFSLELWNQSASSTSPVLNYSGTNYTGTVTDVGGSKYTLNRTVTIPASPGTKLFSWFFSSNEGFKQSNTLTQTVDNTIFSICNSTLNVPYLNLTFKNESVAQEVLNGSLAASTFEYYLGSGSVTKTYSLSSTPVNRNYTLCLTPSFKTVRTSVDINYYNAESPQRKLVASYNLTNTTTQQALYLLNTAVGIYVNFQVINDALQPLGGVTVNITSSTFGQVETRTTDASGSATFFLNPLTSYTVIASLTGYPTSTTSITPTQSAYTITLGSGSVNSTVNDYFRGISYTITPTAKYLTNQTFYNFNFTISSSYWALTQFGFVLKNTSGSIFGTASGTAAAGGSVTLNRSTGLNETLIVGAYWIIEGNYSNVSKVYAIFDNTGTSTSLANLRNRIALYIANGGVFGLEPFGLNIIVFLIIFTVTGIVSYKYGLSSPFAVLAVMLVMCMGADYMNFLTYSDGLPSWATASFVLGILTVIFGIREGMN